MEFNAQRSRGFTLMELMVVLALVAVMVGMVSPNLRTFILNGRLTSAANDLLRAAQQARSEAIKRQSGLVVACAVDSIDVADEDDLECNYGNYTGWIVYADANANAQHDAGEQVILKGAPHESLTVKSDDGDGLLCFNGTGFQPVNCAGNEPTQTVVMCDARGNTQIGDNSLARAVLIAQTGRTRVTRMFTEVSAALGAIDATCP